METKGNVTVRYTPPTRYDKAPRGSICKVMTENDNYVLYVQTTDDLEHSNWFKMGDFLERAFKGNLIDQTFIDSCLIEFDKNA